MSWYTVAWLAWLGFFGVVEGKALANRRDGDTFSEHVWRWFRVHDARPTPLIVVLRAVLALFLLWLLLHLTFGWLTPSHPLPWR
jgi:hypothetical protein